MTTAEHFDILIFGGGKAGKTLAMDQAKAGKRVAVIEAGLIGGSCINIACIPSKALIRSAEIAHSMRRAAEFGTQADNVRTSLDLVRNRTASVVAEMVAFNQSGFDASGFELIIGWGRFVSSKTISVDTGNGVKTLTGDKVFINLGTTAAIPDIPGLVEAEPITHVEALQLGDMPRHLLILGGGYIGMELGQAFRRLGADVTIIESGARLAPREDEDVSSAVLEVLKGEGVDVALECKGITITGKSGQSVVLKTEDGRQFDGSHLLVATGRRPRTHGIGLEAAGIELDERGFIRVNEHLQTTAEGVWAMGEVAGTPMFTHASLDDYRVVASQLKSGSRTTAGRVIPYCVFIDPEFARVGLNEREALDRNVGYRTARLPMDIIPRARTLSQRKGFMKALIATENDQILGFSMLGVNAGEVMSVVQMAMLGNLPFTALRDGIFAHPTISEGLNMLFNNVK